MEASIALMLFLLSLCFFPGSPVGAGCSGDRDCECSDSSFGRCTEGVAGEKMHVSSLGDCIFQCDVSGFWRCWQIIFPQLFHSFGSCDYLIFHRGNAPHQNCHLFGPKQLPYQVGRVWPSRMLAESIFSFLPSTTKTKFSVLFCLRTIFFNIKIVSIWFRISSAPANLKRTHSMTRKDPASQILRWNFQTKY